MRIERLIIDGFGHFAGEDLGPFDKNIVVFQGANEAGKSTLLAFIQTMLFGFGRRAGRTEVPALAGGEHGGRVVALDSDGRRITIARHAGPHGGRLSLTLPDGSTGAHTELQQLIGFPAEVFCNVFSFDLEQLFEASSLENEDIKTHLYGAGLGTENLPNALRNLEQRAGSIFSIRGRVQEVPRLLNELQDIERQLDLAARDAQAYHDHRTRSAAIDSEREAIRSRLNSIRTEQQHTRTTLHALDDWSQLRAVEALLESLPAIETFPEDGVGRLADFDTRIQSAQAEELRVRQAAEGLQTALAAPLPDAVLDDCRQDIEQLRSQLTSFSAWIERHPRIASEASALHKQIGDGLATLGPDWNAARLAAFDTSIPEQSAVSSHDTALNAARQTLRDVERDVETASTEHRAALTALAEAQQGLQSNRILAANLSDLEDWQQAHRSARAALTDLDAAKLRYDEQQRMAAYGPATPASSGNALRSCSMIAAAGLMLFGAAAALTGIGAGGAAMPVGLAVGAIALGIGVVLLLRGLRPPAAVEQAQSVPNTALQEAQSEYEHSRQRARAAFQRLGVTDSSQAVSTLDDVQERINLTRSVLQQVDGASSQVRQRADRLAGEQVRLERATQHLHSVWEAWRGWLVARALPEDLSPAAVGSIFSLATQLRQQQEQLDAISQEQRSLTNQIDRFRARYDRVVQALNETRPTSMLEVGADTRVLVERYETLMLEVERRKGLHEQLQGVVREHEQRLSGLADFQKQRADLIRLGGTDDAEAFRTHARQFAERQSALHEQRTILARLQRNCGDGDDWLRFRQELATATEDDLRSRIDALQLQLDELESALSELAQERGELAQKMDRLAGDETAVELRAERQLLQEQLRAHASEWSTYTIAREILARARQRYEQERQPEVLQTAERYFNSITAGRYTGVISPIGSSKIQVVRADERRLDEKDLSRGTREQLYLALRFGLISGFGRSSSYLPVIVDDILVNFDPARARATAAAFAELSQTNQILVFTCHPATVEHFRAVSDDVQVVDVQRQAVVVSG